MRAPGPMRRAGLLAAVRSGLTAAGTADRLAAMVTTPAIMTRTPHWTRENHAGASVTLLEGPAALLGLLSGLALDRSPGPARAAVALAGSVAAVVGRYDDRDTRQQAKGLAGHLRALAGGHLTGGSVKVIGIGAGALAAAAILAAGRGAPPGRSGRAGGVVLDTVLIAAAANLINLLDLRPGRAAKAAALLALPGIGRGGAAVVGAAAGVASVDLAARGMLGDCGANALGAAAGTAAAAALPTPLRLVVAAGLVGLTLVSERVSFTQVIERTGWLSALDRLGRPDVGPGDGSRR